MISRNMTFFSAIIAAAALLAMPAFAAKDTNKETKKKAAASKTHASQTQRSANGIYSWDGRYLGTDPDPNIRFQILRDQNQPPD